MWKLIQKVGHLDLAMTLIFLHFILCTQDGIKEMVSRFIIDMKLIAGRPDPLGFRCTPALPTELQSIFSFGIILIFASFILERRCINVRPTLALSKLQDMINKLRQSESPTQYGSLTERYPLKIISEFLFTTSLLPIWRKYFGSFCNKGAM